MVCWTSFSFFCLFVQILCYSFSCGEKESAIAEWMFACSLASQIFIKMNFSLLAKATQRTPHYCILSPAANISTTVDSPISIPGTVRNKHTGYVDCYWIPSVTDYQDSEFVVSYMLLHTQQKWLCKFSHINLIQTPVCKQFWSYKNNWLRKREEANFQSCICQMFQH